MLPVRFAPPAAKYLKKLKDKRLKKLYQDAIDKICGDYTVGEAKTGDLSGFYAWRGNIQYPCGMRYGRRHRKVGGGNEYFSHRKR